MRSRLIIGDILIFLSIAFTVYLSVIMTHRISTVVLKGSYVKVFRYELAVCAFFILFALDVRFNLLGRARAKALLIGGWVFRFIVILVCAIILYFLVKVTIGSFIHTTGHADHAIVLGLALEDGKPADDLLARLDAAEHYLAEEPNATLILTGGNPDANGKTEAAVMRELLLKSGIPDGKMILEDRAETTKDNFRNTAELINPDDPVVLISSDYHMDRAVQTAKRAGFSHILRMPARSSIVAFGANVMWEAMLELNELTLRQ